MTDRTDLLRNIFPGVPEASLAYIASASRSCLYPAGTVICREGDVGETLFIIESGLVEVSKRLDGVTSHTLARHGPGEFFGELAVLQDIPRAATVTAIEDSELLEISKREFSHYLTDNPALAAAVMHVVAARLHDADLRSITELRRKNAELAQAYADLEQEVNRRSQFLTVISHELRTPLTSVKGYMHLLKSGKLNDAELAQVMDTLTRNFDTIVSLVNNILFLQEVELVVPQMEMISLDTIVRKIVDGAASRAQVLGLQLRVEIESGLPRLRGDEASLTQAIHALLDNAIKFSPDGGDIFVKVRREGPHAVISMRDPGVGIEQDTLDHLFDRFHILDGAGEHLFGGIGIGLPLVRAVVQNHAGTIRVESEPGNGSTFTIELPFR
jgi:signal transduction histidine kinase